MPFSESHAKSLLHKLPASPKIVLENRRYWDLTFLRLYLDHCDGVLFDNPKAGLKLAEIGPRLALLIPRKSPEEWKYVGRAEKQLHRELVVRSFAVLGGAYRAAARNEDGAMAYQSAARYADSGPIGPIVRANLDKRLAKLLSAQRRFNEALGLLDSVIEAYRRDDDPVSYADALNTKGYVLFEANRFSEAASYFGRALALAKGTRRTSKLAKRTISSATHNLATAVLEGCSSQSLTEVLGLVIEAKRYQGKCRNSVNREKLAWVEARIHARFGCDRLAQRRLVAARRKLIQLGAPFESALVGLELSVIYLKWADWAKLEECALGTFEEFRALSNHTEAVAALRLWVEGAKLRSLTKESIRATQATIEALVVRGER